MTGIKYLLDTNIVIGLLKGNEAVIQLLEQKNCSLSECAVSQITRMELLSYPLLAVDEENKINQFLSTISILMCDETIEQTTIRYRRQQGGKLPDAIIAATALNYQLELLTMDKKMLQQVKNY
jgi:predicted nucleic acid-binding protein